MGFKNIVCIYSIKAQEGWIYSSELVKHAQHSRLDSKHWKQMWKYNVLNGKQKC